MVACIANVAREGARSIVYRRPTADGYKLDRIRVANNGNYLCGFKGEDANLFVLYIGHFKMTPGVPAGSHAHARLLQECVCAFGGRYTQ